MARVHLVHWDAEDARIRCAALKALGHEPVYLPDVTGTPLMRALRGGTAEAFVVDLSKRPSHGREVAMALRMSPATRHRPLVFVGGEAEKVDALRALLPDAPFTTWGRLKTTLAKALKAPPAAAPIVPRDALYTGRSLAQKLGIAAGERVVAVGAPTGFDRTLGALPAKVKLTAAIDLSAARFIWFVRSATELRAALARLSAVTTQTVWLAWPKKASGVKTDLDGNIVRTAGLATGLVDYKVCSIDETWSGLAFKRARR